MATVELAAALPVLFLLVLAGIYGLRVADARTRCADAAREVARAAARGDARAVPLGRAAAGASAAISVHSEGAFVIATVTVTVRPIGISLAAVTVTERAVAARESTGPTDATSGVPP
jgi:Flp pilus assembly protein TadG